MKTNYTILLSICVAAITLQTTALAKVATCTVEQQLNGECQQQRAIQNKSLAAQSENYAVAAVNPVNW